MNRHEQKKLIGRLRDLPPPPIPPGLEGRLMAKRPPSAPALQRRSAGRRGLVIALASSAVAASLFLALLLLPVGRDAPPAAGPAVAVNAAAARDVSIEYVQNLNRIQETRPCDILPPLPSSL